MDHLSPEHEYDARHGPRHDRDNDSLTFRRARRWTALALALSVALLCAALGVWQLQRRAWKLDLIAQVDTRIHQPVQALPPAAAWPSLTGPTAAYRRVRAKGMLLHDRETLVQAVTERGGGFWVMTPLRTPGGVVLVNRGFVPIDKRDPASRALAQATGTVAVEGLVRMSEPGGAFLRDNDPAAGRWYSRDVGAIARARKLGRTAPFFIDADSTPNPGGYPVGGLTVVRFRNPHLAYALTWFALAGVAAFGAIQLLRAEARLTYGSSREASPYE